MNVDEILKEVSDFLRTYSLTLKAMVQNESKQLEFAAAIAVTEHYKSAGYVVRIANPRSSPRTFVVKTSTRGHPWNFSHVELEKNGFLCEVHMNLMVRSAHDEGIYCVDVGVANSGQIPTSSTGAEWLCVDNSQLITFVEVKKLVIYPMLVAQFVGIVNEIKPAFLSGRRPRNFIMRNHLPPTLASLGYFSGNTQKIVRNYPNRGFKIKIAEQFDMRIAMLRGRKVQTPFY